MKKDSYTPRLKIGGPNFQGKGKQHGPSINYSQTTLITITTQQQQRRCLISNYAHCKWKRNDHRFSYILTSKGRGDLRRARSRDKLYWYLLSCLICCMDTFLMALRLTSKRQPICPTDLNVALTYKTELGNLLKNCFLL